ncbi:MAG: type III-A CRISPR-associated protein Csm2 [Spirulina sp.]
MPAPDISQEIEQHIQSKAFNSFASYEIRQMVTDAQKLGKHLNEQRLKTNQIRKFLDAINRIKAQSARSNDQKDSLSPKERDKAIFKDIEADIVLLKPKLAYAEARQKRAIKPLNRVISAAIDKVHSLEDFKRLVQFIESIIAYHKSEGGD